MIGQQRGRESGACSLNSHLACRIANQCEWLLLTPKPPLPSQVEPLQNFRLLKPLFDVRLYRFPNHLDFRRSIIRRTEIQKVICQPADDLFMYVCHMVKPKSYLEVP